MPLLLLDLDDTLLDRAGAFREWGRQFLREAGAPDYDLEWLLSIDADGMASEWDLAEALRNRYRLRASPADIVEAVRYGILEQMRLDPLLACALQIAASAGWMPVVITNGETEQQEAKLRSTGLDRYLAGWVISDAAGVSKPNPRIFALTAERARARLATTWMVGDSPEIDIQGAAAVGIRSVWLHRGRAWQESRFAPTCTADSAIAAISAVLAAPAGRR